jgi:DNA-binding CsgD family transcriptional regulator
MATAKLSPREQQIAGLIAAGYTDMQITAHLSKAGRQISYYTVRAYVRQIRIKLNAQGPRINLARSFERCCSV